MQDIAVAGEPGLLAATLSPLHRSADVVSVTRSGGVNLVTGSGLNVALYDVSGIHTLSTKRPWTLSQQHLDPADGRRERGVRHPIVLSIVGIDKAN